MAVAGNKNKKNVYLYNKTSRMDDKTLIHRIIISDTINYLNKM